MMEFDNELEKCLQVLAAGGIILYPTDTVWGLGCDATNEAAVNKLMELKGKPDQKGLIVILGSERDVLQYVAAPDMEVFDFLEMQQKPTTVIYENGLGVANPVLNADGSIAIRLIKDDFCRHLVKRFRKPVVSTSANFHGQPAPTHFHQIDAALVQAVDYTVKYRQNDTRSTQSSAIVKWHPGGKVTILRN